MTTAPKPPADALPSSPEATPTGELIITATAMALKSADPYIGRTLDGRYLVERILGEGGMGVVYAGRHKVIDKRVAIKVLRGEMATDQDLNDRFLQEARAASAIGNPHIIDISDFGQMPDGATYFVMELLEGKSLSGYLADANRPIALGRIYHIAKQLAQGLSAAHDANIIHRDLKPDNVMLINRGSEKDFVKILDFGIAKVGSGGSQKVTRAGSIFGTPHYMSPEQAAGATVDHRTDIYALGVILYEMASGKVPFDADNFMGILTQHMYKSPVPIRALVPQIDIPAGLDAVILKCLTKKPEGRYESMTELLFDIEKLERGLLPAAVQEMMARSGGFNVPADYFRSGMPAPLPATPASRAKRWPLYALIAAVATVVGIVGLGVVATSPSRSAQSPGGPLAPAVAAGRMTSALPSPPLPGETLRGAGGPASTLTPLDKETREVLVSVVPGDALIRRDGRELGQSPVALHLAIGESAVLLLERKGYKSRTVNVGAGETKQVFTLESSQAPARQAAPAPPPRPAPAGAPPRMDDVGDPFAKKL